MNKLKSKQSVTDGFCPEMGIVQPTYCGEGIGEQGQIGCDEIKVTGGIGTNVKDDSMRGLAKDFYDVNKILKNLLDEDELDLMEQPTVYINQFCYRLTSGRVYNIMFFYNTGSLPANVALKQLFFCVMCCEMVGSKVIGFIANSGGSMQHLFKYLRKKMPLPEVAWLPIDCVRFINPYDRLRVICVFHCNTHNLKNSRNQVWTSSPDGAKQFFDVDEYAIGKAIIVEAWLRDEARADNNEARRTDLRQLAINLDK